MKDDKERKSLLLLVDAIQNKEAPQKRWLSLALNCSGGLGIVVGYWSAERELLDVALSIAFAATGGGLLGVASFYSLCQQHSKFTLQHLSLESIQKRLGELG